MAARMMDQPNGAAERDAPAEPRLHGDLLTTSLLAMLRGWNAYGYQLAQRMKARGLPAFDQGTVYRTLRQLEKSGFVSSFWDTSESGPARRMYSLTAAGDLFLTGWLQALDRYQTFLRTLWGLPSEPAPLGAPPPESSEPTPQTSKDE
jgi:poly-beta-hydroxybutyrate-responsive repressor